MFIRMLAPAAEKQLNGAFWTLLHCADEKELERIEKIFQEHKSIKGIIEKYGTEGFLQVFRDWLKSPDPVVAGTGAVFLGVLGDHEQAPAIAALLNDRKTETRFAKDIPSCRCSAAMAIGWLGAAEYTDRLVTMLNDKNEHVQYGALVGLTKLGAKQHVAKCAALMSRPHDVIVRQAAIEAVASFQAKEYAPQIAEAVLKDHAVRATALLAIGRLNAREYEDIAVFLEKDYLLYDESVLGEVALALALMTSNAHIKEIAGLLDQKLLCDIRGKALLALAILNARQYENTMVARLLDDDNSTSGYAAVALLVLGHEGHVSEIFEAIGMPAKAPPAYFIEKKLSLDLLSESRRTEVLTHVAKMKEKWITCGADGSQIMTNQSQ